MTAATAVASAVETTPNRCAELLETRFLAEAGWDAQILVLTPSAEHPLLGRRQCRVIACATPATRLDHLCNPCYRRRGRLGTPLEEFVAIPRGRRRVGVGRCSVPNCPRPWKNHGEPLCQAHSAQRRTTYKGASLEDFVVHPNVRPFPSFGPCVVAACMRDAYGGHGYCHAHYTRFRLAARSADFDEQTWRSVEPSVAEPGVVSLRGLPAGVVAEVLFGIQERTRGGYKTKDDELRRLCDALRASQVASILDHTTTGMGEPAQILFDNVLKHVRRAHLSPEQEVGKDAWDLFVFGHRGTLDFRKISQPWLRAAAKRWAADDLPHRRGKKVNSIVQQKVKALDALSESLRAHRDDHGDIPTLLGRQDVEHHLHRLAFLQERGDVSAKLRVKRIEELKWLLHQIRALGLTRPGQPAAGLSDQFHLGVRDVPERPNEDEAGRDLPAAVMKFLCQHLEALGHDQPDARIAVEVIIDTGRRPNEVCSLSWDCLDQDPGGKYVLKYFNLKNYRETRLPIPDATAALIAQQKAAVRERFPDTALAKLKLFPAQSYNPYGHKSMMASRLGELHRSWVAGLPPIPVRPVGDGEVAGETDFDKKRIFLYAYRHSYAQRHADAGIGVDVLCELMDHEHMNTTRGYYRVGEERRRDAVDKVALTQFDRHGDRIWREAEKILDSERLRNGIGEVAVPYGRCGEPTNVQAGGGKCPIRFRCIGCDHFTSDASYLPDLETYLGDLLQDRERIAAMTTADEWAKLEATPSDTEIDRVRKLIRKVKADLDGLSDDERAQIQQAVDIVRNSRSVLLGMPGLRRPLLDLRPERAK